MKNILNEQLNNNNFIVLYDIIEIKEELLSLSNLNSFDEYKVLNINKQNNSINGKVKKSKIKFFYKIQNIDNFYCELEGYYTINKFFPVSTIEKAFLYKNYGVIIYEYDSSIKKNKGLLCDALLNEKNISYKFIDIIKKNYNSVKVLSSYPMQKFFDDRVLTRLVKYLDYDWVDYKIDIGFSKITTREIIEECISYFNKKNRNYTCVLSHGDLNTTNIGTKPIFFDFFTSGYNYINAEIATFTISIMFIDLLFSPKYHKKSYKNHSLICENIPNIDCVYYKENDILKINSQLFTTLERKNMVLYYLNNLNYEKGNLVYYIIMRFLTIFDINNYEEKDKIYSIFLVHYFNNKLKNSDYTKIIEDCRTL